MQKTVHSYLTGCLITTALLLSNGNGNAQTGYNIYTLDVRSGAVRQVSKIANGDEFNPSFSNNGKKIVHDVVGPIADPYNQTIYVTDVRTGMSAPLPGAEGGNDAVYSPDGSTIAFDDFATIYLLPANGGVRSFFRTNCHHASWNPTSNKIAFADYNGYIGTKDLGTGNETFVTNYGDQAAWSPNGQYIAFDGWWWVGGGIWVIKVDSLGNPAGSPMQITTSGYGPTWKNNNKEIVFVDWPDGDPNLYSISINGGTATKIGGRVGGFDKGDYDPAFSINGQYVAWASYTDSPLTSASNKSEAIALQKNKFTLMQNYPNPFNDKTAISFSISQTMHATLNVYNLSGEKIKTLADGDFQAGSYSFQWNGTAQNGQGVASGIYLCQLKTENGTQVEKMILKK